MKTFISVKEAEELIERHSPSYPSEDCPIADTAGRILRETVTADRPLPPFHRVMMDGVALDISAWNRGQRTFLIQGTATPGVPPPTLEDTDAGCIEVMTGAALPPGCDCVIPYEEVEVNEKHAFVKDDTKPEAMQYVHREGSDQAEGDILLEAGLKMKAPHVGIAVAVGRSSLAVAQRPSIAFISNGDELVEPGHPIQPEEIRPINNYAVGAALRRTGFLHFKSFHTPDDPGEIRRTLELAIADYDVILLSGGVSMGRFDFIPTVL